MSADASQVQSYADTLDLNSKPQPPGARVRMYRQGLGDCFLVALPRTEPDASGRPYFILIDCGVMLGTHSAGAVMRSVANDIAHVTGGRIDLLVATHEHWDHLSGFIQAKEIFERMIVQEVWMAWTENPADNRARELQSGRQAMRASLAAASAQMRFAGGDCDLVNGVLAFFGAAGRDSASSALEKIRNLGKRLRYCDPAGAPVELPGAGARLYVLGPPRDEKLLRRCHPSARSPQSYGIADLAAGATSLAESDRNAPFDPILQIPLEAAGQMPFFQRRYWGEAREAGAYTDQSWRRIDDAWLRSADALALALDNITNNCSLALAIELADSRVLLFAADAQVGSWLSWHKLKWTVGGKEKTGPDLLRRTVFYKVGHHGSHNATLREGGLELMRHLELAMIPVDRAAALKRSWQALPSSNVERRLKEITGGCVLRADREPPAALANRMTQDPEKSLYFEVKI